MGILSLLFPFLFFPLVFCISIYDQSSTSALKSARNAAIVVISIYFITFLLTLYHYFTFICCHDHSPSRYTGTLHQKSIFNDKPLNSVEILCRHLWCFTAPCWATHRYIYIYVFISMGRPRAGCVLASYPGHLNSQRLNVKHLKVREVNPLPSNLIYKL